jgi:ABC-type glycerol-3-phosphate transport system substrate-binding protein
MSSASAHGIVSRRKALRTFALVAGSLAVMPLLQACGGSAAPSPTPAVAGGAPGSTPAAVTPTLASSAATTSTPAATTTAATPTPAPAAAAPTNTPAAQAAAAQPTPSGYTSQGSKGQIQLIYWADQNGFFKKLIDKFTGESGIGVKYDVAPADYMTWQQLVTTRLASGDATLDTFHGDDFQAAIYGSAGWLEPLDPLVKQFNIDLSDWPQTLIKDVSSWEGKLYRLPWGNDTEIWFYRSDFFKEAGVEPPKDWDSLVQVATKLTKAPDRYGIVLCGKANGILGNDVQHWTNQAGGAINRLDTPGSKQALTLYKDLFKKYKVAEPSTPQEDYGTVFPSWLNNKYAMWWCWDGFLGAMRQTKDFWKDQVSVFLPPKGPANAQTVTGAWGWSISALSKKKDLAAAWFDFVNKPENMKQQMVRGRVPARISLWSDKDVQDNAPSAPFLLDLAKAGDTMKARPVTPAIQQVYDAAEHAISAYLTDQVDLDTAVKDAMAKIKDIEAKQAKKP